MPASVKYVHIVPAAGVLTTRTVHRRCVDTKSRCFTLFVSAFAAVALIAATSSIDALRVSDDLSGAAAPLSSNSTTTTPESAAAPITPPSPLLQTNASELAQICTQQCGVAGSCIQSTLTGTTFCKACAAGASLNTITGVCVDGAYCSRWPWCTHAESGTLKAYHATIMAVGASYNYTPIVSASQISSVTIPNSVALANTYYAAKKQVLATNNTALDVSRYWDDEQVSSNVLSIYITTVASVYMPYVTSMKQAVCARTWIPGGGDCEPPALS
jgi:hypothetical protein